MNVSDPFVALLCAPIWGALCRIYNETPSGRSSAGQDLPGANGVDMLVRSTLCKIPTLARLSRFRSELFRRQDLFTVLPPVTLILTRTWGNRANAQTNSSMRKIQNKGALRRNPPSLKVDVFGQWAVFNLTAKCWGGHKYTISQWYYRHPAHIYFR